MRALVVALVVCGCSSAPIVVDAGEPPDAGSARDAGQEDGGPTTDGGARQPFDAGVEPTAALRPVRGELTIVQLDLPAGLVAAIGESALVIGPDGTTVLIDVGNGSHDDDIRDALAALGLPNAVDWIILTHFHGDHIGGLSDLLTGAQPVTVRRGVVHRGFVDLGPGAAETDVAAVCNLLRDPARSALDVPLCEAAAPAPCSGWAQQYPATGCPGLSRTLDLGAGATLEFLAADAHVGADAAPAFPDDTTNQENARSIVGLIRYGAFRYHFAGDLTGAGTTAEPDVESFVVSKAAAKYGALGVDVTHVNHHARNTSSNAAFTAKLAPLDGRTRNLVAGINAAYLGSPQGEVLTAWLDANRLSGGSLWATQVAPGGATHASLLDAKARVIVQTIQGGAGYRIQAARATPLSQSFPSVAEP